nr:hypothetical protein [Tanacetum cinerariifolium]
RPRDGQAEQAVFMQQTEIIVWEFAAVVIALGGVGEVLRDALQTREEGFTGLIDARAGGLDNGEFGRLSIHGQANGIETRIEAMGHIDMLVQDALALIDISGVLQALDDAVINAYAFHFGVLVDRQMHLEWQTGDLGLCGGVLLRMGV